MYNTDMANCFVPVKIITTWTKNVYIQQQDTHTKGDV